MAHENPLLLLDNTSMLASMGHGEYNCHKMSFDEVRAVFETFDPEDIRLCFSNAAITDIVFPWLGLDEKTMERKAIEHSMHVGQEAIVFKLHVRPSKTKPLIDLEENVQAKKISNVYVYCQYLTRIS